MSTVWEILSAMDKLREELRILKLGVGRVLQEFGIDVESRAMTLWRVWK
jgi:hypothetical protein